MITIPIWLLVALSIGTGSFIGFLAYGLADMLNDYLYAKQEQEARQYEESKLLSRRVISSVDGKDITLQS